MKKQQKTLGVNVLSMALLLGVSFACSKAEEGGGGGAGGSTATGGTGGSRTGGSGGGTSSGGTGGGSSATGGTGGGSSATGGTGGGSSATGGAGGGSTGGAGGGTGGGGGSTGGTGGGAETGAPETGAAETGGGETGGGGGAFTLTSPDFLMISNNRLCHKKEQTSSGTQTSPGLSWTGLPEGTMSIAVSLKDRNGGTHWVMWDIPPTVTSLPKDINRAMKPEGSKNSGNWYGPGAGLPFRTYEYRVWAIKTPTLPGGCAGKGCYPAALMSNSIAFKELLVVGTSNGTCPQ